MKKEKLTEKGLIFLQYILPALIGIIASILGTVAGIWYQQLNLKPELNGHVLLCTHSQNTTNNKLSFFVFFTISNSKAIPNYIVDYELKLDNYSGSFKPQYSKFQTAINPDSCKDYRFQQGVVYDSKSYYLIFYSCFNSYLLNQLNTALTPELPPHKGFLIFDSDIPLSDYNIDEPQGYTINITDCHNNKHQIRGIFKKIINGNDFNKILYFLNKNEYALNPA